MNFRKNFATHPKQMRASQKFILSRSTSPYIYIEHLLLLIPLMPLNPLLKGFMGVIGRPVFINYAS